MTQGSKASDAVSILVGEITVGFIWVLLMFALGIFQLAAFQAGLQEWLGLHWLISIFIGVVALMLGPLGSIAVAIVGFFGAMNSWHWAWWQAGLLCFPTIVLFLVVTALQGTASLGGLLFSRKQN